MRTWISTSLVVAVLIAGCGSTPARSGAPGPAPTPSQTTAQQPEPAGSQAPLKRLSDLSALEIPWPTSIENRFVSGLKVAHHGKSFALWFVQQGDGLMVWREGDREGVLLSSLAMPEVAFTSFGLYFVQLTGPLDGKPQIMEYHWGAPKPSVALDSDRLKGYPRGLRWDQNWGLVYSDDEGPKHPSGDMKRIEKLQGPPLPASLRGEAFTFHRLRYFTVVENRLVMASAADGKVYDLGEQAALQEGEMLLSIRWDASESVAAVAVGEPKVGSRVALVSAPKEGVPTLLGWREGAHPVMLNGRLYLADKQNVIYERGQQSMAPVARIENLRDLAADPAGSRLFVLTHGDNSGKLYYMQP